MGESHHRPIALRQSYSVTGILKQNTVRILELTKSGNLYEILFGIIFTAF